MRPSVVRAPDPNACHHKPIFIVTNLVRPSPMAISAERLTQSGQNSWPPLQGKTSSGRTSSSKQIGHVTRIPLFRASFIFSFLMASLSLMSSADVREGRLSDERTNEMSNGFHFKTLNDAKSGSDGRSDWNVVTFDRHGRSDWNVVTFDRHGRSDWNVVTFDRHGRRHYCYSIIGFLQITFQSVFILRKPKLLVKTFVQSLRDLARPALC